MGNRKVWIVLGLLVVAAAFGVWWWPRGSAGTGTHAGAASAPGAGAASAPPVSVSTVVAERRDWPLQIAANGSVTPLNAVEIRAQVSAVVTKVHIREGQFVKAGEPLFTLDARADEANLAKAQAQLERDRAALADAERQLARSRDLLNQKFVSQSAVDANLTLVETQQAVVNADLAAIAAAKVSLGYSRIVAPSAGRAGAIDVFVGSLVQPSSPPLVTITQLDPIAVAFTLPQRDLPGVLAALRAGNAPVQATLPDNGGELVGRLAFVDNAVDAASGTVKVKAVFDNRDLRLWPGAFVNVALSVQTLRGAVVLPQAAIVQGATAKTVFVVGGDAKVTQRTVEVLAAAGTEAAVSGVEPGSRVVVEGKSNLRPGSVVRERGPDGARGGKGGGADRAPANGAASQARIAP